MKFFAFIYVRITFIACTSYLELPFTMELYVFYVYEKFNSKQIQELLCSQTRIWQRSKDEKQKCSNEINFY